VNLILLLLGAVAFFAAGYVLGRRRNAGSAPAADNTPEPLLPRAPQPVEVDGTPAPASVEAALPAAGPASTAGASQAELARLVRSGEAEAAALRQSLTDRDANLVQGEAFAQDRRRLFDALARSRAETARYRQLVVDIENNAPPVLFGTAAPDDLKLIVGVGPVLERMLHQLGVTSYRDIARWSERDIDEFDARLAEFPGRIRRDGWVTQARELHQSKYGEAIGAGARR
jgi:predicted flap endonuclease-1-like 5' DNA nuclease